MAWKHWRGDGPPSSRQIPFVVVLYENINFHGRRRYVIEDVHSLSGMKFNDATSSIKIFPGPHYRNDNKQKVRLSEHHHGGGKDLFLDIGAYSSIHSLGFGDKITSVAFIDNSSMKSAHPTFVLKPSTETFKKIPVIVLAFEHSNLGGAHIVMLRSIPNIKSRFGNEWNDVISSVNILKGPTWNINNPFNAIWKVGLYKHAFPSHSSVFDGLADVAPFNIGGSSPAMTITSNNDGRINSLGNLNDEISGIEMPGHREWGFN